MKFMFFLILIISCSQFTPSFADVNSTEIGRDAFSNEHFNFKDYTEQELKSFVNEKFPIGTSKESVDKILIEQGKAEETGRLDNRPEPNYFSVIYNYKYNDTYDCNVAILMSFDKDNTVSHRAQFYGGCL